MIMRFAHALVVIIVLLAAPVSHAQTPSSTIPGIEQRLALRSVDRATVRIIAIGGAEMAYFDSRETRVRRMFAAAGNHVLGLKRISIGGLKMPDDLAEGDWRVLEADEVASVFK